MHLSNKKDESKLVKSIKKFAFAGLLVSSIMITANCASNNEYVREDRTYVAQAERNRKLQEAKTLMEQTKQLGELINEAVRLDEEAKEHGKRAKQYHEEAEELGKQAEQDFKEAEEACKEMKYALDIMKKLCSEGDTKRCKSYEDRAPIYEKECGSGFQ